MPSCLGPDFHREVLPQILAALGKLALGAIVTGSFLTFFAHHHPLRFQPLGPDGISATLALLLIISPLWFGISALLIRIGSPLIHWSERFFISSLLSALIAVSLLPDFLAGVLVISFKILDYFLP